jgi:hypothetical protein
MGSEENLITNALNLGFYANLNELLLWKRCIYMTFEQYTGKEHINDKIYMHHTITKDIKSYVINHIKELSAKLPFKKVPKPIYVAFSKKIEYDPSNSIFPTSCKMAYDDMVAGKINFNELKKANNRGESTYNSYDISCFLDKDKQIQYDVNNSFIKNNIFIYDRLGSQDNIENLKKSSLAAYKFNGNYEVYIYVPNLSVDLRYFTSFNDFSSHNKWMDLITNSRSKYLSILPFNKDYRKNIIQIVGENEYERDNKYKNIVKELNEKNEREFPYAKDMSYICFEMGCSSEYGEDLSEIVPTIGKTYDEQLSNSRAKGPYFPTKCLKTSYYDKHMMKINQNDYKKGLRERLEQDISSFKNNYEKIQKGETPNDEYSSDNIIDVIKGSASRYRKEIYNDDGDGPNNYSKEYNRKIMSELAFRHNSYPGVQEIVFPVFRLNDSYNELTNYTHFMPWGNILLKQEYVLNENDVLKIDEISLKSFNKMYEIKYDIYHKLSLFANGVKTRTIVEMSMQSYTKRSLIIEGGSINMYGYDVNGNNDNRYSIYVSRPNTVNPFSVIIENDGNINVYDNGFNKINTI